MPRQTSIILISGTLGDITYYQMHGKHWYRRKTSLNKERIMTDPAFAGLRRQMTPFRISSKLASQVYQQLSRRQKGHGVIRKLVKEIWPLVLQKRSKKKILAYMQQRYGIIKKEDKSPKTTSGFMSTALPQVNKIPALANNIFMPTFLSDLIIPANKPLIQLNNLKKALSPLPPLYFFNNCQPPPC